jgi:hypothetical protein
MNRPGEGVRRSLGQWGWSLVESGTWCSGVDTHYYHPISLSPLLLRFMGRTLLSFHC